MADAAPPPPIPLLLPLQLWGQKGKPSRYGPLAQIQLGLGLLSVRVRVRVMVGVNRVRVRLEEAQIRAEKLLQIGADTGPVEAQIRGPGGSDTGPGRPRYGQCDVHWHLGLGLWLGLLELGLDLKRPT
jgi:hypothetical protein